MTVQARFFASLKQKLTFDRADIAHAPGMTARRVWDEATGQSELPLNTLCAINLEYAKLDDAVEDGDEVAFFPPVTGG